MKTDREKKGQERDGESVECSSRVGGGYGSGAMAVYGDQKRPFWSWVSLVLPDAALSPQAGKLLKHSPDLSQHE